MKVLKMRYFKELIMKKIIFYASVFAFTLFLTSCFDPIYPRIRSEIELEKATKAGYINSLVRYQGDIYMSNGSVFYKSTADSAQRYNAWTKDSSAPTISYNTSNDTFNGAHIIKLAADDADLYALGVKFSTDKGETRPSGKVLYRKSGGQWNSTPIWSAPASSNDVGYANDNITIFCTNSIDPNNRRAYLRVGTTVYQLDPNAQSSPGMKSGVGNPITFNNINVKKSSSNPDYVNSAVAVDNTGANTTWFFSGLASGSNEIQTGLNTYQNATYVYWSDATVVDRGGIAYGSTVYYEGVNSGTGSGSVSTSYPAYSMAVNSDSIILGTYTGGIYRLPLSSAGVPSSVKNIDDVDGADALGSPYIITTLLSLHPDRSERANAIYAGVTFRGTEASIGASSNNVCLWAYYPSRRNWNRE